MKSMSTAGISRTVIVLVIIVILVVAGVGIYFGSLSTGTSSSQTTTSISQSSAQSTSTETSISQSATTASQSTTGASYQDTAIIGTTDSLGGASIDPVGINNYFGQEVVTQLGAPLIDYSPGTNDTSPSNMRPALATSWQASSDGLAYTFILRSGVKFADGTSFNSSAVVYHFIRGLSMNYPEGGFASIGYNDAIANVTATNSSAVVFHLKSPFEPFLSLLTNAAAYIVEPSKAPMNVIVNFTGSSPSASNPNSLGPYILSGWTRSGSADVEMDFSANPNYWNYPNYPKTPHIVLKFYPDATSLSSAIRSGDVDVVYRQLTSSDVRNLQATQGLKVYPSPGPFIQYLVLNENIAPFGNVTVRQAIAASVNRTNLINTVFLGTATPLYSLIPVGIFAHQDVFKQVYGTTNYALAKQLLAKLGYSPTNKLVVDLWYESTGHYPQSADQASVLKNDFEASGVITVNLHGTDWSSLRTNIAKGTMAMWIYGWYPDYIDPFDYTFAFFYSKVNSFINYGYNNSQMDSLVLQASAAFDQNKALGIYQQIQNLTVQQVPLIPLYQGGTNCCGAVAKTSVSGLYLDVTFVFRFYTILVSKTQ